MLRSTADMLKTCNAQGVRAYHGEEYPHWGLSTPKTYITARLLWNVNADVEALFDDYCQRFFEGASAPMRNTTHGSRRSGTPSRCWGTRSVSGTPGKVASP